MSETDIPRRLSVGGRNWQYHVYNGSTRHQWYRPMDDEEVYEITGGTHDSVDDLDFKMLWEVSDDPVFVIELTECADMTYEVEGKRTNLGGNRSGMVAMLGEEYYVEDIDSLDEAVETVREFARSLS